MEARNCRCGVNISDWKIRPNESVLEAKCSKLVGILSCFWTKGTEICNVRISSAFVLVTWKFLLLLKYQSHREHGEGRRHAVAHLLGGVRTLQHSRGLLRHLPLLVPLLLRRQGTSVCVRAWVHSTLLWTVRAHLKTWHNERRFKWEKAVAHGSFLRIGAPKNEPLYSKAQIKWLLGLSNVEK